MLESTWLFVGGTALLSSAFALSTQTQASQYYDRYADPIAIVAGLLSFFSWGILAYGSLDMRVVGDSVTYSFTQPAITLWCIMFALPGLYVALTGPLESLKQATKPTSEDL